MLPELFQTNPTLWLVFAATLGLAIGSFLNVVILRLPVMLERQWHAQCAELLGSPNAAVQTAPFNLLVPRSQCPKCGHAVRAHENIPLLSWLLLRGRCSGCGERISARYPVVELATAVLTVAVAWQFGATLAGAAAMVLTWVLIALSVVDIDHQLLPDALTLPFLWLGLALSLGGVFTDSHSAIIGAIAGYLSLWAVYQLFRLTTGKEGMGYGDFKLLALLGAWLGWQALPVTLVLSSLVGAVVGVGLILFRGRDRDQPIPFGPYLAAAGWIALMWGEAIAQGYLRWSGLG
jgi:leader peptidase (prepilin peptidase) / N-methyltransferase